MTIGFLASKVLFPFAESPPTGESGKIRNFYEVPDIKYNDDRIMVGQGQLSAEQKLHCGNTEYMLWTKERVRFVIQSGLMVYD